MIVYGELVCNSGAEYFERRHSLNARQTWRLVGSSLTAVTEGNNNFFRLVAVKQCCMWSSSTHEKKEEERKFIRQKGWLPERASAHQCWLP